MTITTFLNRFNYKFLIDNDYIEFTDKGDKKEVLKDIIKFLRVNSPEKIYELEKAGFYKSKNNKPELLLLWLEKCYRQTLKQEIGEYNKKNVDYLVNYIFECAKNNIFNEINLVKEFSQKGIFLVIQDDIPGSKIRGVFKVHKNAPAIYITRKHKRIADIYFALLHELAHCKSDFNKAKSESLVSYDDSIEEKADFQAYNWMVNNEYYQNICIKQNYNIELEEKYPKSFIVYRLAKDNIIKYESSIYQKYNTLINFDNKLTD